MYDEGVTSEDDPQFQAKFEDTFPAASLQIPWYLVGGNHDYYGNIDAQIEYSSVPKLHFDPPRLHFLFSYFSIF